MKLIKISPKFQITIPSQHRHLCQTGWLSVANEKGIITLRPVEIQEAKSDDEIISELLKIHHKN
jgi:hypothetical protein